MIIRVILNILIITCFFTPLFAKGLQEDKPSDSKIEEEDGTGPQGIFLFGAHGGYGITYPTGDIGGDSNQKAVPDSSYLYSGQLGYMIFNTGAIVCNIEYTKKTIALERNLMGAPAKSTFEISFINFMLGYKGLSGIIYWEVGLYYGLKYGDWSDRLDINGTATTKDISDSNSHNEIGIFLGGGVNYKIFKSISIEAGVRIENSFIFAHRNSLGDKIRTNAAFLVAGVLFIVDLF